MAPGCRPRHRHSCERGANLRSLGVEQVHVVNLRLHPSEDEHVDLDSQLAEMSALRDEGKIGAVGISTVDLDQLRQALPVGIACVQNAYSLLDRASEDVLGLCQQNSVAWVPYFPLGSAFPGMPTVTENPVVIDAANALGVTPAQVGLAWLLAHDPHTLLIPGTSDPGHLEENIAAGAVHLDAAPMAALDAI